MGWQRVRTGLLSAKLKGIGRYSTQGSDSIMRAHAPSFTNSLYQFKCQVLSYYSVIYFLVGSAIVRGGTATGSTTRAKTFDVRLPMNPTLILEHFCVCFFDLRHCNIKHSSHWNKNNYECDNVKLSSREIILETNCMEAKRRRTIN